MNESAKDKLITLERLKRFKDKVINLNNLVNYYLKSETYTKAEVNALISAINQFIYQSVETLPEASASTMKILFLVPADDPEDKNFKEEYITIDNGEAAVPRYTWEKIGTTSIDLSGYATKQETDERFLDLEMTAQDALDMANGLAYTYGELDVEVFKKANKATTLAGYGIKDAYTKSEVNTALAKKLDSEIASYQYVLKQTFNDAQIDISETYATKEALSTYIGTAGETYATKSEIDTKLNKKLDTETAEETYATIEDLQKISSVTGIQDIGEFNPLKAYDINDICLHDQMLWVCTEPHEGQWDEEHFSLSSLTKILKETMDKRTEKVTISFISDDEITWNDYSIIVENISSAHTYEYPIAEDGTVVFDINKGDMYKVSFPVIESYTQPGDRTFMAENNERELSVIYSHDVVKYERANIYTAIRNFSDDISGLIDGMEVTAMTPSGDIIETKTFTNGSCYFDIPYKTRYVLSIPELDEYTNDYKPTEYTAGVPSRNVLVTYSIIGLGVFGLDVDGNKYSIEMVQNMSDDEKESIIAIGYNDKNLHDADRGDGTTGCGFCFKVGEEKSPTALQWATNAVEFDTEYLPFLTNDAMALPYCAGMNYTTNIIRIGKELEINTPAASHCAEQTLTIGGVTRQGFLPAYGQIRRLALNKNQLDDMYEALGKDAPNIASGHWWASCQTSATLAVVLSNGSFGSATKTNTYGVLRVFDL